MPALFNGKCKVVFWQPFPSLGSFFCLFSVILMGSCGNVMVSDSGRPNFFSLGLLWALWCVLLVGL